MDQRLSQVQKGLAELRQIQQDDIINLRTARTTHPLPDSDEESEDPSPCPIMDKYYNEGVARNYFLHRLSRGRSRCPDR